jgi:DNA-binding SARP family transcriptional activator
MASLSVRLFGKFSVQHGAQELEGLRASKVKELFCYLLLHRDRVHSREVLASLLWEDCTTAQSKKYFRQTLWQLQQALNRPYAGGQRQSLQAEWDCVRLVTDGEIWSDVTAFEFALAPAQNVAGEQLNEQRAQELTKAVDLYQGDLLEGWYQDWCVYERERLQQMYLNALGKLMTYCEAHQAYEAGVDFGERLLRQDRAREHAYTGLMRLQYLAGDRAGALRNFQRCKEALHEELDVEPSKRTVELYQQIRSEHLEAPKRAEICGLPAAAQGGSEPQIVNRLKQLRALLLRVQQRIQQDIETVDEALETGNNGSDTRRS